MKPQFEVYKVKIQKKRLYFLSNKFLLLSKHSLTLQSYQSQRQYNAFSIMYSKFVI